MAPPKNEPGYDVLGDKLDLCLADAVVKTGSGVVLGALSSLLFLGRRRWPIIAGFGVGIGLAYANCKSCNSINKVAFKLCNKIEVRTVDNLGNLVFVA